MNFCKISILLLIVGVFLLSCVSKPAEPVEKNAQEKAEVKPATEPEKKEVATVEQETQKETEKKAEPEVFTPLNFAEDLKETLDTGTASDALTLFENVPPEYKEDFSLNLLQASLCVSTGDVDKAAELSRKLEEKEPENIEVLVLNTMIAKRSGDEKRKVELLKKILEKDPKNADALVEMGHDQMLRKKPNFKVARNYYEQSIKADENETEGWFGYGQASYYLRDDDTAKKAFETLIEKDPKYSIAYAYMGKLYAEKENYFEASKYIEKAIELDPDYYDYWIDDGLYLRFRGKLNEAVEAWTKAVNLKNDYFLAYVYRASVYDELKEWDKSLEDYRAILKYKPDYYYAHESVGMLEWKKGNSTEARKHFEQALKVNDKNLSYKLMIAATYIKEKKNAELKKFIDNQIRNMNRSSAEYAILRLYLDGIAASSVDLKIRKEKSVSTKGKMLFYLGMFYELHGNDEMAKKYYIEVNEMQAPMFIEYQMNEWLLNGETAPLYERKK